MTYKLPPLPFKKDALEPHVSERTLSFHYDKHHKSYVDKTNAAIEGTNLADCDLETIVQSAHETGDKSLFNNAAQAWNHTFFWSSMSPEPGEPSKELAAAIKDAFGGLEQFKNAFVDCAVSQFGSGWAWLVVKNGKLEIVSTSNADLPMVHGQTPLLTCDVWEHAYYLDYQNERKSFVEAYAENLINWDFASANWKAQK